eukprot:8965240-Pyramimonas_sp.AAC.1
MALTTGMHSIRAYHFSCITHARIYLHSVVLFDTLGHWGTLRLPELREAIKAKLARENGLNDVEIIVSAGANQAFMNVVLTLMDDGGRAVLFAPYYFNHLMALQMTGHDITVAECDDHMMPDLEKLRPILAKRDVRMVVICTPCNPTGVVVRTFRSDQSTLV